MEKQQLVRVLSRKDVVSLAFGAMIGWGWAVLAGDWIREAGGRQHHRFSDRGTDCSFVFSGRSLHPQNSIFRGGLLEEIGRDGCVFESGALLITKPAT
jgi:hypothetical protein